MKFYKLNTILEEEAFCIKQFNSHNSSLLLWHLRYVNLGYNNLKVLLDKSMVNRMPFYPKEAFEWTCEGCAMGKLHCQFLSKKTGNDTNQILELVWNSICGCMDGDSVGGLSYFMFLLIIICNPLLSTSLSRNRKHSQRSKNF